MGTQIDWGHPLSKELIGIWLFNENMGDEVGDISGYDYTGTLTNMSPAVDWVGGKDGYALDFDGADDHLRTVLYPDPQSNLSFGYLCRFDALSDWRAQGTHDGANRCYLGVGANNYFSGIGDSFSDAVAHGLAVGEWHMLFVTAKGGTATVYDNGNVVTSFAYTAAAASITPLYIGARADIGPVDDEHIDGVIAVAWFYERALTAQEVYELYINPYAMFQKPFRLREPAVPTVTTLYNCTLYNATFY
jgi:hypothetical protein